MKKQHIFYLLAAMALAIVVVSCGDDDDDDLDPGSPEMGEFELQNAFPNLSFELPVLLTHSGDGSHDLFVVEKTGRIILFSNDAATDESFDFLDIRDRVNSNGNEEGLLGLAFHPQFANNGEFYVNYTAASPSRTVISRFTVGNNGLGNPTSEEVLLEFSQPFTNHNGGMVAFGPDGYLYIATGDGGAGGDPQNNSQNTGNLLGNMLRIDVDNPDPGEAYGIPTDNPFVNDNNILDEIYAYGLRNPWRFSFDLTTGNLWLADVGQDLEEEVDIITGGGNYGWKIVEGNSCFESNNCNQDDLVAPVATYGRSLGRSITGGYVYRGSAFPSLTGQYVFGDFVSGNIFLLNATNPTEGLVQWIDSGLGISSFAEDAEGELYVLDYFGGSIYRFVEQ